MSPFCLLQGRDQKTGFCRFGVKPICFFFVKNAKSREKDDARKERGWCSLGTALVQPWYDAVLLRFFFSFVKSCILD